MLVIFIIIIVSIIALCDFSPIFLDEDLEDILYYRDQEEVQEQTNAVEEAYKSDIEEEEPINTEEEVVNEELPYAKTVCPEDEFDSYEDETDYKINVDAEVLNSALEDMNESDITDTDAILQQIIQDSEIV